MLLLLALPLMQSCSDDDGPEQPSFGSITISPEKDVYHVGDVITCSIKRHTEGGKELKNATYWWYTSWWFKSAENEVDFEEFDSNSECVSQPITLTEAGDVTLYFFGKLEYPRFDWKKVEIGRTIKVVE